MLRLSAHWSLVFVGLLGCSLPHAARRTDGGASMMDVLVPPDATGPCPDGEARCGDRCVQTQSDPAHCGACGAGCALANATARCEAGRCAIESCATGFADCDRDPSNGCEASLASPQSCGACGTVCTGATPNCDAMMGRCSSGCSGTQTRCGEGCAELASDANNCGACGTICSAPNGTPACVAGRCVVGSCVAGFSDCDANATNGCETPLGTDRDCTRCGEACTGATPICDTTRRACSNGCSASSTRCGMNCVDTNTNTAHCGACSRACALPNAVPECAAGVCRISACMPGFADCDANPVNGCEVDTRSSATHCGGCGRVCSPANAVGRCAAGVCSFSMCAAGFGDCDRDATNGCEVDTRSSLTNCGACGTGCTPSNATAQCAAGACGYTACAAGFLDCDRNRANGCEVDGRVSMANCGTCGAVCARANGTAACMASACQLTGCSAGFGNCDGNAVNGCEAAFATDANHCGACGVACPSRPNAVATCAAGACSFRCNANFADCDANVGNGCESDLRTVSSCGSCGRVCTLPNATPACASGNCAIGACSLNHGDCNRMAADGCEATLDTTTNCRACGTRCVTGQSCTLVGCVCPIGEIVCGPACANVLTDENNCGRCGRVCPAGATCNTGTCVCAGGMLCTNSMGVSRCCAGGCTAMGTCA